MLSVATARAVWKPSGGFVQVKLNGALVSLASATPFVKNTKFVTEPSTSLALAASSTFAGARNSVPLTGFVSATAGGVSKAYPATHVGPLSSVPLRPLVPEFVAVVPLPSSSDQRPISPVAETICRR